MIKSKGTRKIVKVEHLGPETFVWHMACGHVLHVKQRPRDGQRSAICRACRGRPATDRDRGQWRTATSVREAEQREALVSGTGDRKDSA